MACHSYDQSVLVTAAAVAGGRRIYLPLQ